jgi:hypothetical protein
LQRDIDVCAAPTQIRAADALKARFQDLEIKVRVPLDVEGVVFHDERKITSSCYSELRWTIQSARQVEEKLGTSALPAFKQAFSPNGLEVLYTKQAQGTSNVSHESVVPPAEAKEHTSAISHLGGANRQAEVTPPLPLQSISRTIVRPRACDWPRAFEWPRAHAVAKGL